MIENLVYEKYLKIRQMLRYFELTLDGKNIKEI